MWTTASRPESAKCASPSEVDKTPRSRKPWSAAGRSRTGNVFRGESRCPARQADRQPLHPLPRSQSLPAQVVQANRRQGPLQWQVHRMSRAPSTQPDPMKTQYRRRSALSRLGGAIAGLLTLSAARAAKAAVQKVFVASGAPKDYDPTKHKWLMCIDVNRCIGCGLCVEACKKENGVPEGPYFRTWIERYEIGRAHV